MALPHIEITSFCQPTDGNVRANERDGGKGAEKKAETVIKFNAIRTSMRSLILFNVMIYRALIIIFITATAR